ncbi:MAG TPA: hypothetical protein VLJ86_04105 [Ramlibacter sp.]|nr:hypothetical protein [Ramlibacter sp.]
MVLPVAILMWLALCCWMAHKIGELFIDKAHRRELKALIFLALLPLILIDEMIGSAQFDELCRERAVVQSYTANRPGAPVYVSQLPPEPVGGLAVPVFSQRQLYVDVDTHQTVLSATTLRAEGGKLARALRLSGAREPLTFSGVCSPRDHEVRVQALRIERRAALPADSGSVSPRIVL